MVNHLFEETEEQVFFVSGKNLKNADERTHISIKRCVDYEDNYRKYKRIGGKQNKYDEVYDNFLRSIAKFKEIDGQQDSS